MKATIISRFLLSNLSGCIGNDEEYCQFGQQVNSGIRLIMEEIHRQEQQEGCSLEFDEYTVGKLALVAACYAEFAILSDAERDEQEATKDSYWPWDEVWWKPKSPLQDLVHAGALIAAEIDRLLKVEPYIADQLTEK